MKALFKTHGCKLNQAETSQIKEMMIRNGIIDSEELSNAPPEIIFINGCAVTQRAVSKSRHTITRMIRENPEAILIVAGCIAQAECESLRKIPGISYIIGTDQKYTNDWWVGKTNLTIVNVDRIKNSVPLAPALKSDERSRPFLKIQDGCDHCCTYCLIPKLRGSNKSIPLEMLLSSAESFVAYGSEEIVLTGVRIGSWGKDLPGKFDLVTLLNSLVTVKGLKRIRLGSLEPWELTDSLLEFVIQNPKICPHLHIPLQHLHSDILSKMGRPALKESLELIFRLRENYPDLALGTDIIAGFPGEKESEFKFLLNGLKDLPLTYMHAFTFSKRPGTRASIMPDQVSATEKKVRVTELIQLAEEKKAAFTQYQVGSVRKIIPDRPRSDRNWVAGVSENYLKVLIPCNSAVKGKEISVKLEMRQSFLTGKPIL